MSSNKSSDGSTGSPGRSYQKKVDSRENFDADEYERVSEPRRDQDPHPDVESDDGSESRDY